MQLLLPERTYYVTMSLTEYQKERDLGKTEEPKREVSYNRGRKYVIQKHNARHLHYDLRLERDGVLKSWAVPKEPSLKKGIKRLAVQVEDHSVEYAGFEGTIPEGEYGAGTVEIWDNGTYGSEKWEDNEIIIQVDGERLNGRYCLIRFKKEKNNWLFFRCGD